MAFIKASFGFVNKIIAFFSSKFNLGTWKREMMRGKAWGKEIMDKPLHLHKEFTVGAETVVEVHFDQPAKVYLMDGKNYDLYCQYESFSAFGGPTDISPIRLRPSGRDDWHLVIESSRVGEPLNVQVKMESQPKVDSIQARDTKRSTGNPKIEPAVESMEVEASASGNSFVLMINRVRKTLDRIELRALVRRAWSERETGKPYLFDWLASERRDILEECAFSGPRSPMILALVEYLCSHFIPKKRLKPEPDISFLCGGFNYTNH